jgi:hypothetical protein
LERRVTDRLRPRLPPSGRRGAPVHRPPPRGPGPRRAASGTSPRRPRKDAPVRPDPGQRDPTFRVGGVTDRLRPRSLLAGGPGKPKNVPALLGLLLAIKETSWVGITARLP